MPGLRIPLTADRKTFAEAVELGRKIIWVHTFGEHMTDAAKGRPAQPSRLPASRRPNIPKAGAIPQEPATMPDSINYDANKKRLLVRTGYAENVEPGVRSYKASGKKVFGQWFSYRKANRERPIIGGRPRRSATSSPIIGSPNTPPNDCHVDSGNDLGRGKNLYSHRAQSPFPKPIFRIRWVAPAGGRCHPPLC